jgi:hypothetical protein
MRERRKKGGKEREHEKSDRKRKESITHRNDLRSHKRNK